MNRLLRLSRALRIAVSSWWEDRGDSVIGMVGPAHDVDRRIELLARATPTTTEG
jgi:hypothetical protein